MLGLDPDVDVILTNIPRGKSARRMYGFDQSELIARALSEKTGIPYVSAIVRRRGGKVSKPMN